MFEYDDCGVLGRVRVLHTAGMCNGAKLKGWSRVKGCALPRQ